MGKKKEQEALQAWTANLARCIERRHALKGRVSISQEIADMFREYQDYERQPDGTLPFYAHRSAYRGSAILYGSSGEAFPDSPTESDMQQDQPEEILVDFTEFDSSDTDLWEED